MSEYSITKTQMPDGSISTVAYSTPTENYNVYANAFDLSLLPNTDGDLPSAQLQQLSIITNSTQSSQSSIDTSAPIDIADNNDDLNITVPSVVIQSCIDDYIPTTVLQHFAIVKTEDHPQTRTTTESTAAISIPSGHTQQLQQQQQQQQQWSTVATNSTATTDSFFTIFPPSPTPSHDSIATPPSCGPYDYYGTAHIKKEFCSSSNSLFPPSPPDSHASLSPRSTIRCGSDNYYIKGEQTDSFDIDSFFGSSPQNQQLLQQQHQHHQQQQHDQQQQDHQLLREFLQDTTFQRKHNLRPLALETLLMGGWDNGDDIGPVISLALEHARKDVQRTCEALRISPGWFRSIILLSQFNIIFLQIFHVTDPQQWTVENVQSWLLSTVTQFGLAVGQNLGRLFPENGAALSRLSDEDFIKRLPQVSHLGNKQLFI